MYLEFACAPPADAIRAYMNEGVCAWCGMPCTSFVDGLVCPHLFLRPTARVYRISGLANVFETFDLYSVIEYLRVVAESDRGPRRYGVRYSERVDGSQHVVEINWRDRGWRFEFAFGTCTPSAELACVRLSTVHRGKLFEQAVIELPGPGRAMKVTPVAAPRCSTGCAQNQNIEY